MLDHATRCGFSFSQPGYCAHFIAAYAVRTEDTICALVSSHPHAIRALEKAIKMSCDPVFIKTQGDTLLKTCPVPYLKDCSLKVDDANNRLCITNTNFDVDHSEILNLIKEDTHWALGLPLGDGEEYLAAIYLQTQEEPMDKLHKEINA